MTAGRPIEILLVEDNPGDVQLARCATTFTSPDTELQANCYITRRILIPYPRG